MSFPFLVTTVVAFDLIVKQASVGDDSFLCFEVGVLHVHIGNEDCCAQCFCSVFLALGEANKKTSLALGVLAFRVL